MSECPNCGSSDVMDDGRGWWFCNDCPWGEDPQPRNRASEPAPNPPVPVSGCLATFNPNPDQPWLGEVLPCGRTGPHDGNGPFTMHRDAGCHWHWTDESRGALTTATGEDTSHAWESIGRINTSGDTP